MPRTSLREVLEAIAAKSPGIANEKDAVALLDLHLGLVQACQHTDAPTRLIQVRDDARKALQTTFKVRTESVLARSHADVLEKALAPLERLIDKVQTEEKPEKVRFDKRWEAVGWRVEKLLNDISKSKFGGYPGEEMEAALKDFGVSGKQVVAQKDDGDYALANKTLDRVEKDLKAFDIAFAPMNGKAKEDFQQLMAKLAKSIEKMDAALAAKKFGDPLNVYFRLSLDQYVQYRGQIEKAEQQNDYLVAKTSARALDQFHSRTLNKLFDDLKLVWSKHQQQAQQVIAGIASGAFPGGDDKALKAAVTKAEQALKRAESDYEGEAAVLAVEGVEKLTTEIRTAAVQGLIKEGTETPKVL